MKILQKKQFGTWALITGASSGIGEGFAFELARQGFNLVLVARNTTALEQIGQKLQGQYSVKVRTISLDLSQPQFMNTLAPLVEDLDIGLVISNAGAGKPQSFLSLPLGTLEAHANLNGLAHAHLAHFFGNKMLAKGRGGILFIGAMGASEGIPYMANDGAAKAYVISLARSLNHELNDKNIHVTVVSPGPVETPVIAKLGFDGVKTPMKPAPVKSFVAEALWALSKNKKSIISGRLFRFMTTFMPRNAMTKLNGVMLQKASEVLALRA